MNKGLARLIFIVVFLIPVVWYLILQLFGSNTFALELKYQVDSCYQASEVVVIRTSDSLSITEQNYLQRVEYATTQKSISLVEKDQDFFQCINQSEADLVLINEQGLWGGYELSREGVDVLLTELDILILQNTYGEGAYR